MAPCVPYFTGQNNGFKLRLNAMRKFIANVKHYTDVNIYKFYANIYNAFTAYVKVQTYLHTYLRHICNYTSKLSIYLRMYLLHVCMLALDLGTWVSKYGLASKLNKRNPLCSLRLRS